MALDSEVTKMDITEEKSDSNPQRSVFNKLKKDSRHTGEVQTLSKTH